MSSKEMEAMASIDKEQELEVGVYKIRIPAPSSRLSSLAYEALSELYPSPKIIKKTENKEEKKSSGRNYWLFHLGVSFVLFLALFGGIHITIKMVEFYMERNGAVNAAVGPPITPYNATAVAKDNLVMKVEDDPCNKKPTVKMGFNEYKGARLSEMTISELIISYALLTCLYSLFLTCFATTERKVRPIIRSVRVLHQNKTDGQNNLTTIQFEILTTIPPVDSEHCLVYRSPVDVCLYDKEERRRNVTHEILASMDIF